MNKKYKETFSAIRASDEAIERAINVTKTVNKKRIRFAPAVAVACCFAVLVGGIISKGSFQNGSDITSKPPATNAASSASIVAPGFAYIAYASEKEKDDNSYLEDEQLHWYHVKMPMKSKIGAIDIRDKSQHEVDLIVEGLYKEYNLVDWDFPSYETEGKNVLTLLDTNTSAYKNAVIYQFRDGFFDLDILDCADEIKEIRVRNSSEYGSIVITSLQVYYDENGNLKDEYQMFSKGIHKNSISGEEYKRDIELQKKYGKRMFGISWDMTTAFVKELNENPEYDLSQIQDTLTIEVEFNDGSVSQSNINLSFDEDGYMFAEAKGFEFSQARVEPNSLK